MLAGDTSVNSMYDLWPRGGDLVVREEGQWAGVVSGDCRSKREARADLMQRTGRRAVGAKASRDGCRSPRPAQCGWEVESGSKRQPGACPLEVLNLKCFLSRSLSKFEFLVSEWNST